MTPIGLRTYALLLGVICHSLFVVAISIMAYMLFFGLTRGIYPIGGEFGHACNVLLLFQFPIVHSALLTTKGRSLVARLAPQAIGKELVTTNFAIIASLQLLLVFVFWTPTEQIWWQPTGYPLDLFAALYVAAWIFLAKALYDGNLAIHSGLLGWRAVVKGEKPNYGPLPTRGVFSMCRQPIYLGFAAILLTAPTWGPDRFLLTITWTLYCIFGPLLKEQRLLKFYGQRFQEYREVVPYLIWVRNRRNHSKKKERR